MTIEHMMQIDPDDMEGMDIQWQIAIVSVKALCFMEKPGKKKFGNK